MNISGDRIAQSRPFKLAGRTPLKRLLPLILLVAALAVLPAAPKASGQAFSTDVNNFQISGSGRSVTLTWSQPDQTNYNRFWIEYYRGDTFDFSNLFVIEQTTTTISKLNANTEYFFRIRSCFNTSTGPSFQGCDGNGSFTSYSSLTTGIDPPGAPTNLRYDSPTSDSDPLRWNSPSDNGGSAITHYEYRSREQSATSWGTWTSTMSSGTTFSVTKPDQSKAYEYQVRAVNAAGNSGESNMVLIAARPDAPTNVIYTFTSSTSVLLSWDPPEHTGGDGVALTGYTYEHSSDAGVNWSVAGITGASATSTPVGGLTGADYVFRVRAENADRNGLYSANASLEQVYDQDGNGRIDIVNLAQLNAVRWDLNGDGVVDNSADADSFAAAFPSAAPVLGCLDTDGDDDPGPCIGYELVVDLDFDTGTVGDRTDDDFYNQGFGWRPIGSYSSVFDGNGRTIANLHINRPDESGIGLFSIVAVGGVVRDLGLTGVDVNGNRRVGGLAGATFGAISGSYSAGSVNGIEGSVGGLVGDNRGRIINSHALGEVRGDSQVGGLVGTNNIDGGVTGSYAAGTVSGRIEVGGLAGRNDKFITRSFAVGTVSGSGGHVGGLVGENGGIGAQSEGTIDASYAMATVRGLFRVGGLVGANNNTGKIFASYAAGTVHGIASDSVEIGGLYGVTDLGSRQSRARIEFSYHDRDISGISDDHGRSTEDLTGPTGYNGIFAQWNRDLDGDNTNDDPWDFGTNGQYPVLKVDWSDADTIATWQEFGYQTRLPLPLTVTRNDPEASLSWPDITEAGWIGSPSATYALYRDGEALTGYGGQSRSHTDTGLTVGQNHVYQVALLLDGVEFRRSREVSTEAATLTTDPSPLTERTLNGARLTVDLARTEYVSDLLPEHFEIPATAGLSIARVNRVSNTRARLTLAFGGNFESDLELSVTVDSAANFSGATLTTESVTVTPAPAPAQVTGVIAVGGSGSLDVTWDASANADGYVVEWRLAGEPLYQNSVIVPSGFTTRTTLSPLEYETAYEVQVYATSSYAAAGPPSVTVTGTTLAFMEPPPPPPPADAIVWHTVPCPLSEANLDGSTITLALLDRSPLAWQRNPHMSHFTASGVPGVSVTGMARVSDNQVALVLAYDDTDFDEDSTLLIRIDENALHFGGPISAATTVEAVVEDSPQVAVTGVRVTPGPRRITVNWDAVPDAHGYKVQWRRQGQDWQTDRREVRGRQRTLEGLRPGTEYDVRVIAIRDKAPYGEPSEAVTTETPAFGVRVSGTEPSPLTEYNLNEATLIIDMEGAEWALNIAGPRLLIGSHLFRPKGVDGVWVEHVERVSPSRVKLILGYSGGDIDKDADGNNPTLTLELHEDTNGWKATTVDVTVEATDEAKGDDQKPAITKAEGTVGANEFEVSWNAVTGATAYKLEWKGPGEAFDDHRQDRRRVVLSSTSFVIKELDNALKIDDDYTVRVAASIPRTSYGPWSAEVPVSMKAATQETPPDQTSLPQQRASVTVRPTSVTLPEGYTGSYSLVLDAEPTADVSITMSSDNPDVEPYPNPITFTPNNWQTAQLVGVPAAEDDDAVNDTATVSHTVSGGNYDGVTADSVTVTITDEDTAGIRVSETGLNVPEGGLATYTVSPDAQPVEDVSIFVVAHGVGVTAQPTELTFTPDNWRDAQTVTVSAAHDDNTEDEQAAITHGLSTTAGSGYGDVTIPNVDITVTDDDKAGVTLSATGVSVREGSAATYTVVLDAWPSADVAIEVRSDNADVSTQPTELTFTADNWQTAQTVTVSAGEDEDQADGAATVTHTVSGGGNYEGVTADSVAVSVTDDDTDREALRDFYQATGGDNWTDNANWLSDKTIGEWHGVTVNEQGEVTALVLDGNNLSGSLPAELGKLGSLTRLALNRNGISGPIPAELGSLSGLSIIGIARNSLSGNLPAELGNLSALTKLSLHDNTGLSGALPSGLTDLANLQRLAIANTGICIPAGDAFSNWLGTVPDKPGIEDLTACASP